MKKVKLRKTSQSSNYVKSVQQNKQVAFYRVEKYELSDVETTLFIFNDFQLFCILVSTSSHCMLFGYALIG